jgi:membrane-associated phospholipid phosphatase
MVLMMKDKNWQLLILIAAVLVGYSRIYLAQHFLSDVMIGAVIGCGSGVIAVYLVNNLKRIKMSIKKMHRVPSGTLTPPSTVQPA